MLAVQHASLLREYLRLVFFTINQVSVDNFLVTSEDPEDYGVSW